MVRAKDEQRRDAQPVEYPCDEYDRIRQRIVGAGKREHAAPRGLRKNRPDRHFRSRRQLGETSKE